MIVWRLLVIGAAVAVLSLSDVAGTQAPSVEAAFPGANGQIGFISSRDAGSGIYVWDPDSQVVSKMPTGSLSPSEFEWSADGKRVVFRAGTQIFVMDADGSNLVPITNAAESADQPTWSPDGTKIAFHSQFAIWVGRADGTGGRTKIAGGTDEMFAEWPAWSPDGSKIAYLGYFRDEENWELFTVSPNGGTPAQLTNSDPDYQHLSWSPDGTKIAVTFFSNVVGSNIVVLSASGAFIRALTSDGCSTSPGWSPDGERIAFKSGCAQGDIFVTNADGTGTPQNITNDAASDSLPDWQPEASVLRSVEFTQAIQRLQTVRELQSDLAGDGKPPVPIVAGKPLAIRVYFDEVDTATSYNVKMSGELDQEVNVTLDSGCTAEDRRKGVNNCESVDFYLTPPQGEWSVRLVVKDVLNAVVLDETFNLTSVKTDDVTLKAVSVCDSQSGSGGSWECQDAFPLINDASLIRRMFPTADVKVIVTGDVIRRNETDYTRTISWWGQVDRDLDALHSATDEIFGQQGTEIYYFGLVRDEVPGNTAGAAYIDTRGAAGRPSRPATVAHEVGHAMGLDHTDTSAPALSGNAGCWLGARTELPPYPYADNKLRSGVAPGEIEVGFDVASGTPLNGEFFYEMMGYCLAPAPPLAPDITRWITPFSTMELIAPAGPLSLDAAAPQAGPASVAGDFWLVSGTLGGMPQTASLDPLVTLEVEGSGGAGAGTHRIEVHDGGGGILFTRLFTPAHGHGSPEAGDPVEATDDSFAELIPVQEGAAIIQVFDGFNSQIGQIELTGAVPVVESITLPASFSGVQTLSWSVTDPDSSSHTYWVDYSTDGGQTWRSQARGMAEPELTLDFDLLAASGGQGVFRVIAMDGVNSSEATSEAFSVAGKAPHGQIIGPQATSFRVGDLVWLESAAWDIDDGALGDGAVTWSSNRDGALGTGANLPEYDLSVGTHTITMTARDNDNNTLTDTASITVSDAPIVEGEEPGLPHIWGDSDCDGAISSRDNQALSRKVLEQTALSQTEPCPALGDVVNMGEAERLWGDLDCNGTIGARDGQALLRNVLGQNPLSQTQPCPGIGDTVAVRASQSSATSWWREHWWRS